MKELKQLLKSHFSQKVLNEQKIWAWAFSDKTSTNTLCAPLQKRAKFSDSVNTRRKKKLYLEFLSSFSKIHMMGDVLTGRHKLLYTLYSE